MRKLFILFLVCWCGPAAADTMYYVAKVENGLYGSQASACQAHGARLNSLGGDYTYKFNSVGSGGGCMFNMIYKDGTDFGVSGSGTANPYTVPSCPTGQVHQEGPGGGGCVTPPPAPCTTPSGSKVSWNAYAGHRSDGPDSPVVPGSVPNQPTSSPTCGISGPLGVDECWNVPSAGGGRDIFCKYSATSNGQNVPSGTPSDSGGKPAGAEGSNMPPTKSGPNGSCPAGSSQGGVDSGGIPICVGSGTNPTGPAGGSPTDARPTASTTTKGTDAAGNKVTTTTSTRDNGDGSKTTTKTVETEGADGSKASTTTTTTGLTPGGKQGQPDKPDNDLCRLHPELNICRNSSIAGQCGQITCMGDAIQCATLREAATIQCRQKEEEDALKASPLHALGQGASSGNDPEKGSLPSPSNGQTVDISALNADGWLGGGAAFEDVSFTVQGHTITVPLSNATSLLVGLRYALMVAAALVSFRILSGAILGG